MLVGTFGITALCVASLIGITVMREVTLGSFTACDLAIDCDVVMNGLLKFFFGASFSWLILKGAAIPEVLLRILSIKHEIAIEEAKRKLKESVPDDANVKKAFLTASGFGRRRKRTINAEN